MRTLSKMVLCLVISAVLLLNTVSNVEGGCVGIRGCVYNGVQIKEGESFQNDNCQKCSCSGGNIGCCGIGQVIRHIDPRCEVVQLTRCYQAAVLKRSRGKPCPYPYGGVPN